MKTKTGRGFTLTELLVVVLVIAILAAVAVPMYKRTVERSKASDAIHVLDTVAAKQEVMWVETGSYAPNFAKLAAPVKGLTSTGNATIGNFTYAMDQGCAIADKGTYKIYKNYATQETGCTGPGCDLLKGLVTQGTVGCSIVNTTPEDEKNPPEANICDIDPAFCCGSGENWNGVACVACASPKVWNSSTKSCVCGNVCPGGANPNPATCVCACSGTCPGGKIMTADCRCECPVETPNWNGEQCVPACSSPRTRWTGSGCDCPLSAPNYLSASNKCISSCTPPKVWDGNNCTCPDSLSDYRTNCINTKGTWDLNTCSCKCGSILSQLSGTSCVCPAPKTRFDGSSCVCPQDREVYHAASNTCIGKCESPLEWNFTNLKCECPASAAPLRQACEESEGVWNNATCSCSCPLPKQLNAATGACECFAPRTRWTGSACECPLLNPNWNATAATCNPPCNDPKSFWNGTACDCPTDKPKFVSNRNECCWNTEGNSCGGGVTNALAGVMPCLSNTCSCPSGSALKSNAYCCSNDYPNFINKSLGCCKTPNADSLCGGGIDNSYSTGKIGCNSGVCEGCSGAYPTLRNEYCCLGSCNNGTFTGSGLASCNCVCYVGFKFNQTSGNCDSCGPKQNFEWTDNQCNYTCNTGFCKDSTGKCIATATGQWRNNANGEKCTACTNKPANTFYTGNGGTENTCSYSGNSGYCYNGTSYITIPVGQWRDGEICSACSNKPANTHYTTNGGTKNACGYSGDAGYCFDGSAYDIIPTGQWRDGENCTACTNKPVNTFYTSSGGTNNSCKYSGNTGFCYNGTSYWAIPVGQWRDGEDCKACTKKSANNSYYTTNGGITDSCSWVCNTNNCFNNSDCIATPTGQWRDGNNCEACTNKPANTYYTGNGGTKNACTYSGNSGYCNNGTSYISIPTGQWRSGEQCTACSNKPANTYYTGNGGTSNSCAFSGNNGYCNNGTSYVTIPVGQWREGEKCVGCTNKAPNNSTYTSGGSTSGACDWKCNTSTCYSGTDCINIPTGQWRNDNNCQACSNKPANTHYTGNGGTSNSCAYTGDSGYCYNGTSYITIPSGQWRNGENCEACDNKPANTHYIANGGTSNTCAYSGDSGYCFNGTSYVSIPVGQWRNGENCTACTNKPANTTYTSNGGTANSCSYTGNGGYCNNGSAYVTIPVGQWRNGENCTSCTNKPANTNYTTSGGTTGSCSYTGNTGYCNNGSSYIGIPVGQWRNGESCANCTNKHAYNTQYTANGGTSNSCAWSCNSGYVSADGSCCNASTKPVASQSCGACGFQTRTVTCVNGGWTTSGWSTCSETGKPATNQACGACGFQTRTVTCNASASNPTWSTGSWSACNETSKPATNQTCGTCGYQTRSVTCATSSTNPIWNIGSWGSCNEATKPSSSTACNGVAGSNTCGTASRTPVCNASVTSPSWTQPAWTTTGCTAPTKGKETQSCGFNNTGTQTRTCQLVCSGESCTAWSACSGQQCDAATKPATSIACSSVAGSNSCNTATRNVWCDNGVWKTDASWNTTACSAPNCNQLTSQQCNGGCGTQTRTCTPTCSGGTYGNWSACSAPAASCNQATSQSCYVNGTQTRTCTGATCGGGNYSAWSACTCKSGYEMNNSSCCLSSSKPSASQSCGACGYQTRSVTCSNGSWTTGGWGTCIETGKPATNQTCGTCGYQTRSVTCNASASNPTWSTGSWGTCQEASKPSTSIACSSVSSSATCGTATRSPACNASATSPSWTQPGWSTGSCSAPNCNSVSTSQSCYVNGYQTRTCTPNCSGGSAGAWSACTCNSGYEMNNSSCCLSSAKPVTSQRCGTCGYQTRTATCSNGSWTTSGWSTCYEASRPATNQACGTCGYQTRSLTCNNSATSPAYSVGGWGTCNEVGKPATNQTCGSCGYQTRSVTCNASATSPSWSTGGWSSCYEASYPGSSTACSNVSSTYSCGTATRSPSCNASAYSPSWTQPGWSTGGCSAPSCSGSTSTSCSSIGSGACGTATRTCNSASCSGGNYSGWNTSGCYGTSCNQATSQSCGGGNGTQTRSCTAATCSGGNYSGWSACTCNSGYCMSGSTCVATAGTCSVGAKQTDITGCSNNGSRTRTCAGGCPNYWGSWSACSCYSGWTGSNCGTKIITPVVRNVSAIVNCTTSGSKSYYLYSSVTSKYYDNQMTCKQESNCMYPMTSGSRYTYYSGSGFITDTWCPGGYANDQALCNAMGAGYVCMKSASGSCASTVYEYMCDCKTDVGPGGRPLGFCYAKYCGERYEDYHAFVPANSGSGSYLRCEGPVCSNGATKACQRCGTMTCSGNMWGPCVEPENCTGDSKWCGTCGTQTWNGSSWGTCVEPACCYGAVSTSGCSTNSYGCSGVRTCSGGSWSSCSAPSGSCRPGLTDSRACTSGGRNGTQKRTCADDCTWGNWGTCQTVGLVCRCGTMPDGSCCPCTGGGLIQMAGDAMTGPIIQPSYCLIEGPVDRV